MRRMSKDRATLAFSGGKKPGIFILTPWTVRPGGGMMVGNEFGEIDQFFSAMGLVAESNSVLSMACSAPSAWPPLTAVGHLHGMPSSVRRGHTAHLADLQPLQIGLVHAGRGIRGPTAKRLGHRQPPAAACRGIIRHLVQRMRTTAMRAAH